MMGQIAIVVAEAVVEIIKIVAENQKQDKE